MKTKNKTQISRFRNQIHFNGAKIQEQLNHDELTYNNFLFDCGMAFLETIYPLNHHRLIKHSRSKFYWNWYRMQWTACENKFLQRSATFTKVPGGLLELMYTKDMLFFCVHSMAIKTAFKNYLKVA